VVNLLPDDNQYAQAGEAEAVERLGMDYAHIPIDLERPTITDYEQFERTMDGAGEEPVWVHCAANWRVSAFVSLYGQARLGWSRERGDELVRGIWEPTEPWLDLAHEVLEREQEGGDRGLTGVRRGPTGRDR
jgi:protein tyrosine phosphatase (PTP) superfamily phosphohydrolase (DUF442 family)